MSAIQKELTKTLDLDAPKRGDRQEFLVEVVRGVTKLSDSQWNSMSPAAQNWFNDAVDARNAKATIPEFPDFEEEQEEAPARRRASADDDAPKGGTRVEVKEKDLKPGMPISLVTLRGKEDTGHVIEVVKGILAIKQGNGEEVEYDLERIDKMYTLATESKEEDAPRRRRSAEDDEPADPIKVGVEVKIVTKRGKEETGEIIELSDKVLVLKVGKEELEYTRANLESVTPVGGKREEGTTRRRTASDEGKDTKDTKGGKDEADGKSKRSSNDGVSVGQRISELILDDLKATEEDIAKALKKEGLEFRENTLKLNFKSTHKFLDLLKERKLLKV